MINLEYENSRLLDIVDEQDTIIDTKSRTETHEMGFLHREIHVWLFDENNQVFFQKRGIHAQSAGLLDASVGGHVNKGEDYLDAAVRETKEESGIYILPEDLVFLKKIKDNSNKLRHNFRGTLNNFVRSIYIYKHPVTEEAMRREHGILGVDFKKFTLDFLSHPDKEYVEIFNPFVMNNEVPLVLQYLNKK